MIGHLGSRASALLDGHVAPEEAERMWAHVHGCHLCRDLVERLGAVKTRLGAAPTLGAPDHLKGALMSGFVPGDVYLSLGEQSSSRHRRAGGVAATVGGAAGVAVLGLLAFGAAPADAPTPGRQVPVTSVSVPTYGPSVTPARDATRP